MKVLQTKAVSRSQALSQVGARFANHGIYVSMMGNYNQDDLSRSSYIPWELPRIIHENYNNTTDTTYVPNQCNKQLVP